MITYPNNIKKPRAKLDACESLIEQMILEHNRVGTLKKNGLVSDKQFYVYAHRPRRRGGNVFDQHLSPLLEERNSLRVQVKNDYCEVYGINWHNLAMEDRHSLSLLIYGNKKEIRQKPTKATYPLLDALKAVDVTKLIGEIPPDPPQDFEADYTEVDEDGDITLATVRATVSSMRRDALSYVRLVHEIAGDFEHLLDINVTDDFGAAANVGWWAISDGYNTEQQMGDNNNGIRVYTYASTERLYITDFTNDNEDYRDNTTGAWYLKIGRASTVGTIKIYTDAIREDLDDLVSITCGTDTYDDIYSITSRQSDADAADSGSGYCENLDLQEAAGWTGKILGVTNPAKINGILVASITSVNGVS